MLQDHAARAGSDISSDVALPFKAHEIARGEDAAGCLSCRAAVSVVAAECGLTIEILLTHHRSTAPVAQARQLAMYLAHVALGLPQTEVARAFRRDRTTVAHACRRIEDLRDRTAFDEEVSRLEHCVRWIVKG